MTEFLNDNKITTHAKEGEAHNSGIAGVVLQDFVAGMLDEVKNHKLKLAEEVAIGGAVTVGMAFAGTGPIFGIVFGGLCIAEDVGNLVSDVKIIENADKKFSPWDIEEAHQDIRTVGASSLDTIAFMAAGATALKYSPSNFLGRRFDVREDFAKKMGPALPLGLVELSAGGWQYTVNRFKHLGDGIGNYYRRNAP
jgi:hypothetical protein